MQKTWIDNQGFVRLRSEGNQFIYPVSPLGLDPWLLYDSWDAELAVKMITIGYNLDFEILWDEAKDFPEGSTGLDSARASTEVYNRGMSIAESSIRAGVLKTHEAPANWLAWAKRKGYKTDHLSPRKTIASLERALDACKVEGVIKSYTEQIEKLKQLARIIEPFHADTQSQAVLVVPVPVVAGSASNGAAYDFSILATRYQLIEAFGRFTGMDGSWFKNIKDTPALLAARKVTGQGGRGHIKEPRFCPFEVMQWLADSKRRKGRKLGTEKAWEILEKNFHKVYIVHEIADPRTGD